MNRITKKKDDNYVIDTYITLNEPWKRPMNKLGYTEDIEEKHNMSIDEMNAYITEHKKIEEELGIDLITLFKAIKNGVWANSEEQGIHFISLISWNCDVQKEKGKLVPLFSFSVWEGNEEDEDDNVYFIEEYGKT